MEEIVSSQIFVGVKQDGQDMIAQHVSKNKTMHMTTYVATYIHILIVCTYLHIHSKCVCTSYICNCMYRCTHSVSQKSCPMACDQLPKL